MENKQTAVQWVIDQLTPSISLQSKYIQEFKDRALEMEKQQITDAYIQGREDWPLDHYPKKHSNEYYQATYRNPD